MEDHNRRQVKSLVALGVLAESPVIVGSLICIHTAEVTGSIPVSPTASLRFVVGDRSLETPLRLGRSDATEASSDPSERGVL